MLKSKSRGYRAVSFAQRKQCSHTHAPLMKYKVVKDDEDQYQHRQSVQRKTGTFEKHIDLSTEAEPVWISSKTNQSQAKGNNARGQRDDFETHGEVSAHKRKERKSLFKSLKDEDPKSSTVSREPVWISSQTTESKTKGNDSQEQTNGFKTEGKLSEQKRKERKRLFQQLEENEEKSLKPMNSVLGEPQLKLPPNYGNGPGRETEYKVGRRKNRRKSKRKPIRSMFEASNKEAARSTSLSHIGIGKSKTVSLTTNDAQKKHANEEESKSALDDPSTSDSEKEKEERVDGKALSQPSKDEAQLQTSLPAKALHANSATRKADGEAPETEMIELLSCDESDGEKEVKKVEIEEVRRSSRVNKGNRIFSNILRGLKGTFKSKFRPQVNIPIYPEDFDCLEQGEYLNDTVIDYYINRLLDIRQQKTQREYQNDDVFVFGTFFYKKLISVSAKHEKIDKWTKNVDIFSKRYIFVPICVNLHWSLALIYNDLEVKLGDRDCNKFTILHLDSMAVGHATNTITKNLRPYLQHEWRKRAGGHASEYDKDKAQDRSITHFNAYSVPGKRVPTPKQTTLCDCGLFLLKYLELFLLKLPSRLQIEFHDTNNRIMKVDAIKDEGKVSNVTSALTNKWFKESSATNLRQVLQVLLTLEIQRANPDEEAAIEAHKRAKSHFN